MKVEIYFNESENRFMSYQPGDELVLAHTFENMPLDSARDVYDNLETIYMVTNVGDEWGAGWVKEQALEYRAGQNRSLSVADVVQLEDGRRFAVATAGFRELV